MKGGWACGGVRKQKEERKRDVPVAESPQWALLGDAFREACISAIWQHSLLALLSEGIQSINRKWDEII